MKQSLIPGLVAVVVISSALWGAKVEKEAKKVDKELKKISLTATVLDGRRVVNRLMAEQLGVSREQLVKERMQTGFVYGQLFGAHEVARLAGLTFNQVAGQMKQGHSLLEVSEQHQADLKEILVDAKTLNKRIDQDLDRVENGSEDEQAEDGANSYDPSDDSLGADTVDFSPAEIAQAQNQVHNRGKHLGEGGAVGLGQGRGGAMGGSGGGGMGGRAGRGRR